MFLRIAPIFFLIAVGFGTGWAGLFADRKAAIGALNRLVLYLLFPALVVTGIADENLVLPTGIAFYLIHVCAAIVVLLAGAGLAMATRRKEPAPIMVSGIFGNVAYVGLPVSIAVFGAEAAGPAAVCVAIHIAFNMVAGSVLFAKAGSTKNAGARGVLASVARQPLVYAPFVGLLLRLAPSSVRAAASTALMPMSAAAGSVALIMLGLYLFDARHVLKRVRVDIWMIAALKLVAYPAVIFSLLMAFPAAQPGELWARVAVIIASTPVAISTFSIAEDFACGQVVVAQAIVATTVLSAVSMPLIAGWVALAFG